MRDENLEGKCEKGGVPTKKLSSKIFVMDDRTELPVSMTDTPTAWGGI